MPTIQQEVTIASSPETAWALLADATAVTKWVPGITGARVDGTRRMSSRRSHTLRSAALRRPALHRSLGVCQADTKVCVS
jgi:Polyketide cyclase / dehydrase and lipid transport